MSSRERITKRNFFRSMKPLKTVNSVNSVLQSRGSWALKRLVCTRLFRLSRLCTKDRRFVRNAVKEARDERDERDSSAGANLSCAQIHKLNKLCFLPCGRFQTVSQQMPMEEVAFSSPKSTKSDQTDEIVRFCSFSMYRSCKHIPWRTRHN